MGYLDRAGDRGIAHQADAKRRGNELDREWPDSLFGSDEWLSAAHGGRDFPRKPCRGTGDLLP